MIPRPGLAAELEGVLDRLDLEAHLSRDPLRFVYRFADPCDRELVAVLAALLAYGRVSLIGRALEEVMIRIGPAPREALRRDREVGFSQALSRFEGFVYRVTRGEDLARLWWGLGAVLDSTPSLGEALTGFDDPESPTLVTALAELRTAIRTATADEPHRRGFDHLLPDPEKGSAAKRLCMLTRWMVRTEAPDLGLWAHLGAHRLVMPLDTHIHRLGRYLGLTTRKSADWRTAVQITEALKALSPADPLRFDFALAHMGISGQCPTRRVEAICVECPIQRVCTAT